MSVLCPNKQADAKFGCSTFLSNDEARDANVSHGLGELLWSQLEVLPRESNYILSFVFS